MDEKTAELRDIFVDVTDEDTVTESQDEPKGSLTGGDEEAVADRLEAVLDRLRERFDVQTSLSTDALVGVIRGYYDGRDDARIAADLDAEADRAVDAETVFRARMALHLVDDADLDLPVDPVELRDRALAAAGSDTGTLAEIDVALEALAETIAAEDDDLDRETVERALYVARAQAQRSLVSDRFRSAYEDVLPDAALAEDHTAAAQEDGLAEAAEDIETDTKF